MKRFVILVLLVVVFLAGGFGLTRLGKNGVNKEDAVSTPTTVESPANSNVTNVAAEVPRLPLTALVGHQLIMVFEQKIWMIDFTVQGPRKTMLVDVGQPIFDLALSPDRKKLAFTFGPNTTGLKVLDMITNETTEYIPATENIRYPNWSSDSIYLAVWNSGRGNILYDMVVKRRQLEIEASGSGQIVFLSNRPKISYVENGSLYEQEYGGNNKTKVIDGVSYLDPHYYSTDNNFVVFYNEAKQLMLYGKVKGSMQMLAESDLGKPFGSVVTFAFDSPTLVYYNGVDKENSFYTIDAKTGKGKPFPEVRKVALPYANVLSHKSRQRLLVVDGGFSTYRFDGIREAYCPYTNLSYDFGYPVPDLWSPDAKFVLSPKEVKIASLNNCALTAPFDTVVPTHIIWLK